MEADAATNQYQPYMQAGHVYPVISASGSSQFHLGDRHYHSTTPGETLLDKVSESLFFREILVRYDNIEDNISDTFDWVLKHVSNEQPTWDSFTDWFDSDKNVYWISGKPGSGKSTLMKYLFDHVQHTNDQDGAPRVVLSFWFWEAAHNELQRNLQGCLRSLLWQILQIEGVGYSVAQTITEHAKFTWTRKRLLNALEETLGLLQQRNISTCIFLDGLDESGHDAGPLIDFVRSIAKQFTRTKLCISSRPEQIFNLALSHYPKLRMQDLNRPDIDVIIRKTFLEAEEITYLREKEPSATQDLSRDIGYKAQGILLWVRLVINDLLRGVRNFDTISELQHRLGRMPEELDGLYDFMLRRNSVDLKDYRKDATFFCQLVSHREMSMIEFYLAVTDDIRTSYLRFDDGWETLHTKIDCDHLATRVSVCTGGFLEVRSTRIFKRVMKSRSASLSALLDVWESTTVDFIHRTARSYFWNTTIGVGLVSKPVKSPEEIQQICFEVTLASNTVLYSLETPLPLDIYTFGAVLHCSACGGHQQPSNRETVRSVFDSLLFRGLLSVDTDWVPSKFVPRDIMSKNPSGPLPSLAGGGISYCHLYALYGFFDFTVTEYQTMDGFKDENFLTLLVACLVYGIFNPFEYRTYEVESAKALYDLIIQHGATPNCQITNTFGESTSMFHEVIYGAQEGHHAHRVMWSVWMPIIEEWLLQTDDATISMTSNPTIDTCSSLFFELHYDSLILLGHLNLTDIEQISYLTLPQQLSMRLKGVGTASRQCAIWVWHAERWRPQMYALSPADFYSIKHVISQALPQAHPSSVVAIPGTIMYRWSNIPAGFQAVVESIEGHSTKLKSLSEALLYLGKSAEAIQMFGAAEEARLDGAMEEIAFRHWKSWYYGTEDALLQQYQKRPFFPGLETPPRTGSDSDQQASLSENDASGKD